MFGRKKEAPAATDAAPAGPAESKPTDRSAGKGTATPRRKDQEAARKRPLVPQDRKAAKETERAALQQQRLQMRRALETGDERFLPVRDKGPQRRFARDYVDARWNVGEFLMIAALVFVVLTFIPNLTVQSVVLVAFWVMFLLVVLDGFILGRKLKRRLREKFTTPEPGVVWYGVMRAMQFRKLRLPKPLVRRGEYPS